ncbi:MAG: sigma-54-dependent Fis family transcriptional regulator, partial [Pseudomonadota bacterium]
QTALIQKALGSGKLERNHHGAEEAPRGTTSFAVPLIASGKSVGCLYLDGQNSRFQPDSTDLMFLNALATQLAIALDRAELSVSWIREKDQESRQLREEVRELREAMNPHRPVFASAQMQEQMALIERIAPSEATVLIIGESGTGKEMLAHSVHEYSNRADQPFVTVDCGAISHSLLEAELFGHVKGAYTGAESASDGRIVQADGGTLFLDEIGELPLDVQAKLLRFVQEREIVPVGGTQSRKVDVRIVAATNRELKDEVARGSFRQDLYYRLQVVPVMAQPLRERPDDILPLATAFLDRFATQNNRSCDGFTRDAEAFLLQHHWPGNVRELQHAILRAVLLSDGSRIGADDIELLPEAEPNAFPIEQVDRAPVNEPQAPVATDSPDAGVATNMSSLRAELERQVAQALKDNARRPVPVGKWLQEDMVIALNAACGQVSRRAARVAGVPESTFRRQLDKARGDAEAGLAVRTEAWVVMGRILRDLANASTEEDGVPLLDAVRAALLEVVLEQSSNRNSVGAALMGVSPPTFKRWLEGRAA